MRIGAFILGGIAGAATVMLLRKQSVATMAGGLSQLLKGASKKDSPGKGLGNLFGGGMKQIEQLASKDGKVKHEINEVLGQNEQPLI